MKNMTELVSWFQLEYPFLVESMKNCNHHHTIIDEYPDETSCEHPMSLNPYHLESDVFTHTMMVCKQAENAPYEVQIAALLHDIGKPVTRAVNPKNGNVSFYNHDALSAFMSLEILKREELGLSKEQQVLIFNMIALHTQIYKLSVEQLAAIGDRKLVENLIELGKADHAGRFHTKGDAVIPTIENVYPEVLSGVSSLKRSAQEKEVIILCGLPASGKSTWKNSQKEFIEVSRDECLMRAASQYFQAKDFTYSEAWKVIDQKRVDILLQNSFHNSKSYVNVSNRPIIVDMTHMSKKSRRRSLSHFGPEYKKKCVVFLTDLPTLNLQNSERCGKVIDKKVIDKMMRSFYPPTFEEFDEIEYVI